MSQISARPAASSGAGSAPPPVAVIGAGPVGLAAAAHLLERGLEPLVLEAGEGPGASVQAWAHVRMFSPWQYNIDAAAARLLEAAGWQAPDAHAHPTGEDIVARYLAPLAATPAMAARVRYRTRVVAVARQGIGKVRDAGRQRAPFVLRVLDAHGQEHALQAAAVIDASGTWTQPSPAGADGLPALGERSAAVQARLAYGMPDIAGRERARYRGRRVAVLGGGHSALGDLLALLDLMGDDAPLELHWLLRGADPARSYGGEEADALRERGAIGARMRHAVEAGQVRVHAASVVEEMAVDEEGLRLRGVRAGRPAHWDVDELIVATGFRPALEMLGELRLGLDPALECPVRLAPLIDPNVHSCGTVRPHGAAVLAHPEPGFYIAGMKSYGRAPTFLLATGHEQVRSIAAHLAGDAQAASRVELVLPQTGVCTSAPVRSSPSVPSGTGEHATAAATLSSTCCA